MASVLNQQTFPGSTWSTTNVNEAFPGVPTPLSWSVWGPATERATRRGFHAIGLLRADEVMALESTREKIIAIVLGRPALRIEFFCEIGNRIPGADATAIADQMFSCIPDNFVSRPNRSSYGAVMRRFPVAFVRSPKRVRYLRPELSKWWHRSISSLSSLDEQGARALFADALEKYEESVYWHVVTLFSCIQPVFDLFSRVVGNAADELMCGQGGHEETEVVDDLWRCSRQQMTLSAFLDRHGYHGPWEGELSSVVWREDSHPVESLVKAYADRAEDTNPWRARSLGIERRREAEDKFIKSLPRHKRLFGRVVLRAGARYLPLRGTTKVMFLQSLDVARGAARKLADHFVEQGKIARQDDIFYLTADEVLASDFEVTPHLIQQRRAERAEFEAIQLPTFWKGGTTPTASTGEVLDSNLTGIGASPGVAVGRVRVVHDPADTDVEEGDVLVARTTDPSWASTMFLASALVVDVGGQLSHAAVVARELGIPCVMNTLHGTRALKDGDLCRVDGTTGRVDVIDTA